MFDDFAPESALETFIADDWITDVLQVLKSGKEATAYLCEAHPSRGAELTEGSVTGPGDLAHSSNRSEFGDTR